MAILQNILDFFNSYIVYCLVPAILALVLIEHLYENKFPTKNAFGLIRCIVLVYGALFLLIAIYENASYSELESDFFKRALGRYYKMYIISIFLIGILPFTLIIKRLKLKASWLLIVTLCFTAGVYLDRVFITALSWQRNYMTGEGLLKNMGTAMMELKWPILQGILFALLLLGFFEMIVKIKGKKSLSSK